MSKYYIKDGEEYKEVDGLFDQEALEQVLEKRLSRERAKYADYDDLKSKVEAFGDTKSEYETKLADIQKQRDELETQLTQATLNAEKSNILREFNLSADLEEFVTGSTAEEMRARAEKLSRNTANTTTIDIDKHPKPEAQKSELEDIRSSLFGKNSQD